MVDVLLSRDKYVHQVRPSAVRDSSPDVRVSASFHKGGWEVRWRDASGRRRARRFASEEAARAFDDALAEVSPAARRPDTARHGRSGGVYSYRTADGVRWRFVYRRSDGTQTTKRGFASERAARDARRRLIEQVERGEVRHTKETFGGYWERWLTRRRPYLEAGTWSGYEIAGRKRLRPAFGARPLGELSVDDIREFVAVLAEEVEASELSAFDASQLLACEEHCGEHGRACRGGGEVEAGGVVPEGQGFDERDHSDVECGEVDDRAGDVA